LLYFVIEINGESEEILGNNAYCTHFQNELGNSTLYLDSKEVNNLKNRQYLIDPSLFEKEKYPENAILDYFVRYSVISEGLCYPKEIKPLGEYFYDILPDYDGNEDYLRYQKTSLCYFYYYKYGTPETKEKLLSNPNFQICADYVDKFRDRIYKILLDESINGEWCPYPDFDKMKTPIDDKINSLSLEEKKAEIRELRVKYNNEIQDFFLNRSWACGNKDEYNEEIVNCGFISEELKKEYCKRNNGDRCCHLILKSRKRLPELSTERKTIISGVVSASIVLIIGSYFSAKFINEIKVQDNLKKSIRNQEKEYNESHKQMMRDAYNQGYDVNKQVFNTRSRNLNGTLRNTKQNTGTLRSTAGSAVSAARSNVSTTKYLPNTYSVAQDYQSSDSRDISLRKGMIVQLIQRYEGGWAMIKDIKTNHQGFAPEYCLGSKLA